MFSSQTQTVSPVFYRRFLSPLFIAAFYRRFLSPVFEHAQKKQAIVLREEFTEQQELYPMAVDSLTGIPFVRIVKEDKEIVMLPSQILNKHRAEVSAIMDRYPMISNVRLVGSVARGEDTENSDIDFLVDTASGTTLFDIGGLHEDLVDLLGVPVNIISSKGRMHEYMRMTVERDARAYE